MFLLSAYYYYVWIILHYLNIADVFQCDPVD